MELLQKITIYDLLGYTVPGTILVGVTGICCIHSEVFASDIFRDYVGYICAIAILLGYVVGIMLSEVTSVLFGGLSKCCKYLRNKNELDNIGCAVITKALAKAGGIKNAHSKLSEDEIRKYYSYMYAAIQADSAYARIHNYTSSELLCRNLTMVFLLTIILFLKFKPEWMNVGNVLLGLVGTVFMFLRYVKQGRCKESYMLDWFVQKYTK